MGQGLARFAPLTGVAAVVCWLAGAIVSESDRPDDDAPGAELATWITQNDDQIFIGTGLFALGSGLFIWFAASLVQRLRRAGDDGRVTAIAFAAGVAMVTTVALIPAPIAAGALASENDDRPLTAQTAETLWIIGDGFIIVGVLLAFTFLAAVALSILRTKAFPSWFGGLTALMALVSLILPIGWAVLIWGVPLWTLVVSVWIFATSKREAPAAATA